MPTECSQEVTKKSAYEDALLPEEQRLELMSCFCYSSLIKDKTAFFDMNFQDLGGPDAPNYCSEWFTRYSWAQFIVYGSALLVVLINMIAQEIFIIVAQNEKQYNMALEN